MPLWLGNTHTVTLTDSLACPVTLCVFLFLDEYKKQESFIQLIFVAPPKKHSLLLLKLGLHHSDSMMESPILSPFSLLLLFSPSQHSVELLPSVPAA